MRRPPAGPGTPPRALATAALLLVGSAAFPIGDQYLKDAAWEGKTHGAPEIGGCYMNLGPTGIRARLRELAFDVKYVFPNSPAHGRIQAGDVIVGVNNRPFATPHTFGFAWDKARTGYEGPMMDLGNAIEESEGRKEGVLTLNVRRGDKTVPVKIPLRRLGRFSPTFPYQCAKSDQLYLEICEYLAATDSDWTGGGVDTAVGGLCLLASGNPKYLKSVERAARGMMRLNPLNPGGLNNWNLVYTGLFLGEYYLATGDKQVLPILMDVHKGLVFAQTSPGVLQHQKDWGGYPELGIMEGLAIAAYAMVDKCGVEFDPETYLLMRKRVRWITRRDGCVLYGRESKPGWQEEPIEVHGGTGPMESVGRCGAAMLGYHLTRGEDPQAADFARNVGTFATGYLQYFPDCHGCPGVGIHLMGLGLACSYPEGFRKVMDYHKGYLNLMRTHEPGVFVSFPSRSNAHDLGRRPQFTSATVGLLLCVKEKRLQISGAPLKPGRRYGPKGEVARAKPAPAAAPWKSPKVAAPKPPAEKKPTPKAKAGAIDAWDAKLRARIAEARKADRKIRFRFPMVGGEAELASLEGGHGIKIRSGGSLMALAWSNLSLDDRKSIALALAEWGGIPDFAVAGFYCLATGSVEQGERFLARAGAAADAVRAAFE